MAYNIFWATMLATMTGMIINGFIAGLLSLSIRSPWRDIWMRLTSVLMLVVSITIACSLISSSFWVIILSVAINIAVIIKSRLLTSDRLIAMAGWLVAAASFFIGQSAASGNIVQTEMMVLLGGLAGVLLGGLLGILHLLTKKSGQID